MEDVVYGMTRAAIDGIMVGEFAGMITFVIVLSLAAQAYLVWTGGSDDEEEL
jgi:enoyl reductase-like protein